MRLRRDDYVPVASPATWAALCAHCERLGFRESAFHKHLSALIDREFERGRRLDDLGLSVLIEIAAIPRLTRGRIEEPHTKRWRASGHGSRLGEFLSSQKNYRRESQRNERH